MCLFKKWRQRGQLQQILIEDCKSSISSFYEKRDEDTYFTYSRLKILNDSFSETSEKCKGIKRSKRDEEIKRFMNDYSQLEKFREDFNKSYIENQLEKHGPLLSDIDGKCLDNQQQLAVVTNEDQNLVIAGAGSGKTLTIAGKVAYLVKGLDVDPSQILLITFTTKAKDEMRERVVKKLGIPVEVRTFHALGKSIINQGSKTNKNTNEHSDLIIKNYFKESIKEDPSVLVNLLCFYGNYFNVPDDIESYDNFGAYIDNQRHIKLKTLKQIYEDVHYEQNQSDKSSQMKVRTLNELIIANFLFLNGINYQPSSNYNKNNSGFYLPDYNIYIEYFNVNRYGKAPWLSAIEEKKQQKIIEEKRACYKNQGYKVIEMFPFEFTTGIALEVLEQKLTGLGVRFESLEDKQLCSILKELKKDSQYENLIKLFSTFLGLFKSQGYQITQISKFIKDTLEEKNPFLRERNFLFFNIFKGLYNFYEDALENSNSIDFNDMINLSTKLITSNKVKLSFKYIIIDEYQDISHSRFKLIKAIQDQTNSSIMAVGDDWQSIYRFAGSDVNLFTSFEKMFGPTEMLKIEKTYRNSQQVIDLAGSFVMKNPLQMKKNLRSEKSLEQPIRISFYNENFDEQLLNIIDQLMMENTECIPKTLMLLGRNGNDYNKLYESDLFNIKEEGNIVCNKYPNLSISYNTVHKSKGLEADDVVIINNENCITGFPNQMNDDPILNFVLTEPDSYPYGEERRLFYVALTRTKNRCILMVDENSKSVFIEELINEFKLPYQTSSLNQLQEEKVPCPKCKTGHFVLKKNNNNITKFLGCSNYPACDQTTKETNLLKERKICSTCGSYLTVRVNSITKEKFWGCINYSSQNSELSCTNRERYITQE